MPSNRPSVLSTYLAKITRRVSIDCYRKNTADKRGGSEYELSLQELYESGFEPGQTMENEWECQELGKLISRFLREQKEIHRKVFVRRYWYGDSVSEIADFYGIKEKTVATYLFRTRNRLKIFLQKEGYDYE